MTPVFFSSFIKTDNKRKFLIFIKIYFDKVPSIVPLSLKTIVTPSLHTSFKYKKSYIYQSIETFSLYIL